MNFFGGGDARPPEDDRKLREAKAQVEIYSDLFNKMTSVCFEKCVYKYSDNDLNLGEMSCVDRCVGKYLESQEKVGEVLRTFEENMKAQMVASGQLPPGT